MPSKADEAYQLQLELQGAESSFYSFFEKPIEDWIEVCILEGSIDETHRESDYKYEGIISNDDHAEVYVFSLQEQDWYHGGTKAVASIHIPAEFLADPTPFQDKAKETARKRDLYHENIERNRKIERISNLSQEIERIKATL